MKPVLNQIFITPDDPIIETKGIYIPQSARKPNFKGTITSVGNGTHSTPMKYKVGDRIIYESATPISETLVVTSQHNVFGKLI